ncbi:MAG: signal peptide peptidase SppA [Bacteroidota bacterium]|jgi:protease-4
MKDFFKNVFATVVGVFISMLALGGILVLLFVGLIGIFANKSSQQVVVNENTILSINMSGVLKDRVIENPLFEYFQPSESTEIGLVDILSAIKQAKENNNIKGIYIRSGYFSASIASLNEIRDQLEDFKTTGKFVITYADDYIQGGYFLSSIADKVIMNPQGSLDLHGLSVSRTFYKDMFEKIGVEMQVFKVGTYKSAVEPYLLDKMSDANREQVSSFANNIWSSMLDKIAQSRKVSKEDLNKLADKLAIFQESNFIKESGLVDELLYEMDVKKLLADKLGLADVGDLNQMSIANMATLPASSNNKTTDEIAVLYAEGSIVSGNSSSEINSRYLIKEIIKLQDDDDVKSVVLRVNSPGGSAYASEQIWRALANLKAKKPLVVSMGDYAASGGYYIACNASKIYAQPNTLTGSIGIFGLFPNIAGLTKKIGLTFDQVNTNTFSDFGDITRPMKEEEKAILQKYIERGYDLFLTRCAEGRNMSKEDLDKIAQGRVWTGTQAISIGLVDALGGIDDAVKEAAALASVESYSVGEYPVKPNAFEAFFDTPKEELATRALKSYLGADFQLFKNIKDMKDLQKEDFIQARMPFDIQVK